MKQKKHNDEIIEKPKKIIQSANMDDSIPMDEFHRPILKKQILKNKEKRKTSLKKKIRDVERFIQRDNLPQDIKDKKINDLQILKKEMKNKKEALKFSDRYKKVKFFEKQKVLRKIKQLNKEIEQKDNKNKELLKNELEDYQQKLLYINNYPLNWKYISLFTTPKEEKEKENLLQQKRIETMNKILRTVEFKKQLRDKEIREADIQESQDEIEEESQHSIIEDQNEQIEQKKISKKKKIDQFFVEQEQEKSKEEDFEKRVVGRDGKISKLQKNIEKEIRKKQEHEKFRDQKLQEQKQSDKSNQQETVLKRPFKSPHYQFKHAIDIKPKHEFL